MPRADEQFAGAPIVSGVPWVTVTLLGSDKVISAQDAGDGTLHRFRLTFSPPAGAAGTDHDGWITFAAAVRDDRLRIRCRASVLSRISVSPPDVFFGLVPPGAIKKCTVRLRFHDAELQRSAADLTVTTDLGSEFKANLRRDANSGEVMLSVEIVRSTNDRPGVHSGSLKINAPNGVSVQLPVRAWFE